MAGQPTRDRGFAIDSCMRATKGVSRPISCNMSVQAGSSRLPPSTSGTRWQREDHRAAWTWRDPFEGLVVVVTAMKRPLCLLNSVKKPFS